MSLSAAVLENVTAGRREAVDQAGVKPERCTIAALIIPLVVRLVEVLTDFMAHGPLQERHAAQEPDRQNGFLRGVGLVFAATVISNGLLFAVSLMAARWLPTEEYGVVAAMLSLMVLLTIPSFALQVIVARETAGRSEREVSAVLRARTRQALWFGGGATALAWLVSAPLSDRLHLPSIWPIVFTAAVSAPLLAMTTFRGVLQGRQNYGALGLSLATEGGARFAAAVIALALGTGAGGVTLAPLAGAAAAGVAAWLPLRHLPRPLPNDRAPSIPSAMWATGAYFAGFAALSNTDLLVVKSSAGPLIAGEYAAAAFVGKVVLLLPVAITTVLIPEVAARRARSERTSDLLWQALVLTGASCGGLVLACWLAPSSVAAVTYGPGYPGAQNLLLPYSIAMLIFALASVQVLYALTLGHDFGAWACLIGAGLQAAAMWLARHDPSPLPWTSDPLMGIISIMILTGLVLWLVAAFSLLMPARRAQPPY